MKVYQIGNEFKSSRNTGPTTHFLSVTFDRSGAPCEIVVAETQELVTDDQMVGCIEDVLVELSPLLPIGEDYSVRRVSVSQKDKPNHEAYSDLLNTIIVFASDRLAD